MSENSAFKINLSTGEIEISGSEEFVEKHIAQLGNIIELSSLAASIPLPAAMPNPDTPSPPALNGAAESNGGGELPETFGEWLHTFKDNLKDVQKALIAARFVQSQAESSDFKTAEVNRFLKDHGIKLSNPSQSLKQLVEKKFIFQTRKVGSLKYMRLSTDGQKHLDTLKREEA